MDPDAKLTPALEKEMQEIERWMRNPNPFKLYEAVQHFGVVGDAYRYVSEDKQGRRLEIWPMRPALTRVQATKQGEITGYVMRSPNGDEVRFEADEVLHFPLPNPTNELPDTGIGLFHVAEMLLIGDCQVGAIHRTGFLSRIGARRDEVWW